jgi:hypothetical protein
MGAGESGELDEGAHLVATERDRRQAIRDRRGGRLARRRRSAGDEQGQEREERCGQAGRHAAINARRLISNPIAD